MLHSDRVTRLLSRGLDGAITAQSSRGQVQTVHAVLGAARGRGGIELAVGIDGGVNRLLAGSHGVREDGVHVTVVGTVLKGRPVNTGLSRGVTGHHRVLVVRNDQGLYFILKRLSGVSRGRRSGCLLL